METALYGVIRFGACSVEVAKREIHFADRLQVVSHKVFDLLLHLIEHRDEVVTRAALARSLWGERAVSEKLLAKIVVQLRQAIGDDAAAPRWIKTVHGVGYRFIGDLESPAAPRPAAASADGSPVRLALLPLENCTGEPHFVWIELGLAMLIGQALAADPQIVVVPIATVLRALDGVPAEAPPQVRAATLAAMVGATCVVQAVLRRETELRLDYRAFGPAYRSVNGMLFGDDAVHLGERLAQRLARAVSTEMAPIVRFEHDDPFFNQLLGHATRFSTQRQWRTAIRFIEPALVLEPQSWLARLLLLRALVQCADARAFPLADELLEDPQAKGDERRRGAVHEAVAALVIRRDFAMARRHLDDALQLSDRHGTEDWALRTRLIAALDAIWRGDVAAGLRYFVGLQEAHLASGDQPARAMVEMNLAAAHIQVDDLAAAQNVLEDLCGRFEVHGWDAMQMQALGKLAYVHAALGRTALAWQLYGRGERLSQGVSDELLAGSFVDSTVALLGDRRAVDELDRLLGRWQPLMSSEQPMLRGIYGMARGEREAGAGNLDAARTAMQAAVALAIDMAYPFYIISWSIRRLLLELQAGDWVRVNEVRAVLSQQPGARQNDELQAWLLHAEAAELHAGGDPAAALGRLLLAASRARPGRAHACSLLAATWLQIERGDRGGARRSLDGVGSWSQEHPLGIATAARLAYAVGNIDGAVDLQRGHLALVGRHRQKAMVDLLGLYEAGLPDGSEAFPAWRPLPCLVTFLPTGSDDDAG